MATIARRSIRARVSAATTLATADDLNGVQDASQNFDVSGAQRVIVVQIDNGTAGTTGIDVIEVSKDGGSNWRADDTLLALASDDQTGTLVDGILNAAGVEPVGKAAIFKSGPHNGPTLMRCRRDNTQNAASAAWTTGAPSVIAFKVS